MNRRTFFRSLAALPLVALGVKNVTSYNADRGWIRANGSGQVLVPPRFTVRMIGRDEMLTLFAPAIYHSPKISS